MKRKMKNDINVEGSGWRSSGEMNRKGREKGWRSVNMK